MRRERPVRHIESILNSYIISLVFDSRSETHSVLKICKRKVKHTMKRNFEVPKTSSF